jgi:hypothetical protein
MLALALDAVQGRIGIFDASDQFKFSLAVQASVLINGHVLPNFDRLTLMVEFYRKVFRWSIYVG